MIFSISFKPKDPEKYNFKEHSKIEPSERFYAGDYEYCCNTGKKWSGDFKKRFPTLKDYIAYNAINLKSRKDHLNVVETEDGISYDFIKTWYTIEITSLEDLMELSKETEDGIVLCKDGIWAYDPEY